MNQNLAQQAIEKALLGQWDDARDINLSIIKQNPQDIDALNRLSKTYFELGNIKAAKATIAKILKIDPYNPIAVRCYEKWKNLKKIEKNTSKQLSPDMFLEEPGKTKIVHLIHPCDIPILAKINCGDIVFGNVKSHRVSIISDSGKYIGKLPDDISIKIKKLLKMGYQYVFAIKSIDKSDIKVFIRETYRPEKYSSKSSFSSDKIDYIPYASPEIVHENIDMSSLEDESDSTSIKSENTSPEDQENN
jgi:tetratricopeptide (TPR) repeat protein